MISHSDSHYQPSNLISLLLIHQCPLADQVCCFNPNEETTSASNKDTSDFIDDRNNNLEDTDLVSSNMYYGASSSTN